jgi:transglutaminase-like putative cysteine protease
MSSAAKKWHRFLPKISRAPATVNMDARTLYALATVLLLVQLPHILHLPLWISLTGAGLVGLRLFLLHEPDRKAVRFLLSPITITLLAAATAFLIRLDFGYSIGRDPSVAFLFVLVAAKFAEIRRASDATFLLCLAAFLLLTQYFYSQTILSALVTLPAIVALTYALSILRDSDNPATNTQQLKLVSKLLLHGLPLAAILFLIFPRLPGPLWSLPEDAMARTGLSDSMSPGSIGEISKSSEVAFRVEFDGPPPASHQLYWRGPVLSEFDGRNWKASKSMIEAGPRLQGGKGNLHSYTVMLQPHKQRWLFALDAAISLPKSDNVKQNNPGIQTSTRVLGRLMNDGQLIANKTVSQLLRYRQSSILSDTLHTSRPPPKNTRYLPGRNPKTIEFATSLRNNSTSDMEYAMSVLQHFNRDVFRYTLKPQLLGDASVDEFLFQTKEGFCEHYAAAFVVMMRAAGIPARVVTGYLGGQMNGDYMIVRQSDAHAWAEAYINGAWRRYDPTGYVAPSRVELGLSAALPDETSNTGFARLDSSWLRQTQLKWDAMNHRWQQFVVNFDNDSQDKFWEKFGFKNPSMLQITIAVLGISLVWSLLILGLPTKTQKHLALNERLWRRLCHRLLSHRFARISNESASEFLTRAAVRWPSQENRLSLLDREFRQLRFQNMSTTDADVTRRIIRHEIVFLDMGITTARLKLLFRSRPSSMVQARK